MPSPKFVIASDSFKGSLSSGEVGEAAARGIKSVLPEAIVESIPVADGGEGTAAALSSALNGEKRTVEVHDPLGRPITAEYYMAGSIAIIEMAAASGLPLVVPERRDPLITTSYGTGEMIRDALMKGCRKFLIGIGGSATNDGGTGMLSALGFRFLDAEDREVDLGGGEVGKICSIDFSEVLPEIKESTFTVACDVENPLTGDYGASRIFGPQKGADAERVELLDAALSSFSEIVYKTIGKDYANTPGAGAAGGMGYAFLAFLNAKLQPGVEMILDTLEFDRKIKDASLVITGEGRLDSQTCLGKTPYGVLKRCKAIGIPVVAIGGSIEKDAIPSLMEAGFFGVYPVTPPDMPLSEAMKPECAAKNVTRTVSELIKK